MGGAASVEDDGLLFFKVMDPMGNSIGIREGPALSARRIGATIPPRSIFAVTEIVPGAENEGPQRYLCLASGQGWVFTHSGNDGRQLAEQITGRRPCIRCRTPSQKIAPCP